MSDAQYLIRKLTIARWAIEIARKVLAVLQCGMSGALVATLTLGAVRCPAQQLTNGTLSVTVNGQPVVGRTFALRPVRSGSPQITGF